MESKAIRTVIASAIVGLALLHGRALATVYTFHGTDTSALSTGPVSFTFSLDTAAAATVANGFSFSNVAITENGTLFPANTVGATYGTSLSSPLFFFIDTDVQPFYSGSGTGITFNTGTFAIADRATDGEGTLTISAPTALLPTPEPATWTLLFAGLVMTAAVHRFSHKRDREAA